MALKSTDRDNVLIQWRRQVEVFQWLYSMQIKYQKLFMDFDTLP